MSAGTAGSTSLDERRARAAWSRISEPADAKARAVIGRLGHVAGLEAVTRGCVPEAERFAERIARLCVDRDLEIIDRLGGRTVIPGDPGWPQGVDQLEKPPHCLWVRGRLGSLDRSVALVGARAASFYGATQARELGAGLAERGWTVVSGAAFGIDAAAHEGALAVEGCTVGVLACGAERPYPVAHTELIDRILEQGAIVSEVPPGCAPTRHRFLLRNRVIATMTAGTVVVEAALRSGALNTARTAAEHGRPVGAVPGPVTSMMSAGCHEAIRTGVANLVTDVSDVIDLVGRIGDDVSDERRVPDSARDELDPLAGQVLGILRPRKRLRSEDVAAAAGLGLREVLGALATLELAGWVAADAQGWRRLRTTPGGAPGGAARTGVSP